MQTQTYNICFLAQHLPKLHCRLESLSLLKKANNNGKLFYITDYYFEQVIIVFEKIDLPIVSIHKDLLHNHELLHPIVTIATVIAQN
jgi:hypothetical protein